MTEALALGAWETTVNDITDVLQAARPLVTVEGGLPTGNHLVGDGLAVLRHKGQGRRPLRLPHDHGSD